MASPIPIYNYTNSTGVITIADAADIQNEVSSEYKAAFGTDLVVPSVDNPLASSTPQGLLINAETQARIAVAENNATLANQINPNVAGGVFLDAILSLTGAQRNPATQSVVYAALGGTIGTVIPAGSLASETASGQMYQYYTVNSVTLIDNGFGAGIATNVQFNSVLYGAIPCNANTLTTIISNVIGWNSITGNTAPNPLGQPVQSDASARADRLIELGIQGNSLAGAIIGAVNSVLGTFGSLTFLENTSSITTTVQGVSMVPHSIYVCAYSPNTTYQGSYVPYQGQSLNGTNSTVTVTFTGTPTTSIPAGTIIAENASGYQNEFITNTTVVIGGGGTVSVACTAASTGLVIAPPGTITLIITPVSGVSSVTNASAAVIGSQSLIAYQIVSAKSAGAAVNNTAGDSQGNAQQAMIVVPYSNQQMIVLYDTVATVNISVNVTVTIVTPVYDPVAAITQAINNYAAGQLTGIPGLTVGQAVSAFEIAGAITSQYPGIYVSSCLIAIAPSTPISSNQIPIAVYQIAVIDSVSVVINT